MNIKKVWALYYSAVGSTEKLCLEISEDIAKALGAELEIRCVNKPEAREKVYSFSSDDFVICAFPTYAGKLPNKMLPFLKENLKGGGAGAAAVVTFGNRAYDNSLAELCAVLKDGGFHTVSAMAGVTEHAFTSCLAPGRPNEDDLLLAKRFAQKTAENLKAYTRYPLPVKVPGDAKAPYYIPKDLEGRPANFLKARPVRDMTKCTNCKTCAEVCPMGSISFEDITVFKGPCIKCQACIKACPAGALSFKDEMFLSHVSMLEQNFTKRKEYEMFYA